MADTETVLVRFRAKLAIAMGVLALAVVIVWVTPLGGHVVQMWRRAFGGATVEGRLAEYGPAARERLRPCFDRAKLSYPPARLALIGIKDKRILEVWAGDANGPYSLVRTYPIVAASGQLGPKLRAGDRQVPEGLYEVESLHPNSRFHLALRVNYPNEFDRSKGREDGRADLGGDIMIHGSNASVGCLAMGDQAAEDLFVLTADAGIENTQLIFTPVDFRTSKLPADIASLPPWTKELYSSIQSRLEQFRPGQPGGTAGQ